MSALWVLALGASIGYMAFKRQAIEDRLDLAVKEWEGAGAKQSDPSPPDGANFAEIKNAWKHTDHHKNRDFHERLPESQRAELRDVQKTMVQEAYDYDSTVHPGRPPEIEGVYLEPNVPF